MRAGQHAADFDAELQDVGAEFLRPLQLARPVRVVEDQRVQVAVAGMEDVCDAEAVLPRHLVHALQDLGELVAREDRKSVVLGKSVSVRVDLGGRRIIKQKKKKKEGN